MKIILVGARHGKQVIHWPGVVIATAAIVAAVTAGASLVCFLLGRSFFLLPLTLAVSLPMLLGTVIGTGIKRALQLPLEQLSPLG